jgi:hypothetical protein
MATGFIISRLQTHFTDTTNPRKQNQWECSAPAQGTLRAGRRKNQIRRAQSRAKSGTPAASEDGVKVEAIEFAGVAGRVQIKTAGARSESWICPPAGAGAAGAGCESGDDFAAQQGIVTPCWQQARAWLAHDAGDCAKSSGIPASRKLQTMAKAVFMI